MKKSWSVDAVLAMEPCLPDYSRENLERLFAGRKRLAMDDVLMLDIPEADIIWFCVRVFSPLQYRIFAGLCALDVLDVYEAAVPGDSRVRDCIATVLDYDATEERLRAAARAAGAAGDAAGAARAARAARAAGDAAGAAGAARDARNAGAAGDAAWAAWAARDARAAGDAACERQLQYLYIVWTEA